MKKFVFLVLAITLVSCARHNEITYIVTKRHSNGSAKEAVYCNKATNLEIVKVTFDTKGNGVSEGKIPDGVNRFYTEAGSFYAEEQYKNGKQNGRARYFDKKGRVVGEEVYLDGKLNGVSRTFYENGKPEIVQNYRDDKAFGPEKTYYQNGNLKSEEMYAGEINASTFKKKYYEDGKPESEEVISGDGKEFSLKKYYTNGKLQSERVNTDKGVNGQETRYHEDGTVSAVDTFKNGFKINSRYFDNTGKQIAYQDFTKTTITSGPEKK